MFTFHLCFFLLKGFSVKLMHIYFQLFSHKKFMSHVNFFLFLESRFKCNFMRWLSMYVKADYRKKCSWQDDESSYFIHYWLAHDAYVLNMFKTSTIIHDSSQHFKNPHIVNHRTIVWMTQDDVSVMMSGKRRKTEKEIKMQKWQVVKILQK